MASRNWVATVGAVLSVLALSAYSAPAAACGACVCDTEPAPIISLFRDVALNLAIPLRVQNQLDNLEPPPHLERVSDATTVPATVTRSGDTVWWLQVDQDLEPNTEYRVVRQAGPEGTFTTGTVRDTQAPTLERLIVLPGGNADLCAASVGARLTLKGPHDGDTFNVWAELQVDVNNTAITLFWDASLGLDRAIGHSAMGCFSTNELPETDAGQYPSRIRLRDAAGNVGEWQTFILELMAEQPGGCGDVPQTAGTAGTPSGAADTGGTNTGGTNATGGATDLPATDDSARTSKGCGCVLGQRDRSAHAGCTLLALALAAAARRRRTRQ